MTDTNTTGGNGHKPTGGVEAPVDIADRPLHRPIRKDERIVASRGLYIESWLPERRSRRKPLYLLHGELGGSWLWHRFLGYFAPRGWEGHALNLRGHYWSENADFAEVDFSTYVDDVVAGAEIMSRPPMVIGHGMGGLLALCLAARHPISALILIGPALPAALLDPPRPHVVRLLPREYRRELLGWDGQPEALQRQSPDLSLADVPPLVEVRAEERFSEPSRGDAGRVGRLRVEDEPVRVRRVGRGRDAVEAVLEPVLRAHARHVAERARHPRLAAELGAGELGPRYPRPRQVGLELERPPSPRHLDLGPLGA